MCKYLFCACLGVVSHYAHAQWIDSLDFYPALGSELTYQGTGSVTVGGESENITVQLVISYENGPVIHGVETFSETYDLTFLTTGFGTIRDRTTYFHSADSRYVYLHRIVDEIVLPAEEAEIFTEDYPSPQIYTNRHATLEEIFLGDSFLVEEASDGEPLSSSVEIVDLTVPAGTFQTLYGSATFDDDDLNGTGEVWAARDVGIVRATINGSFTDEEFGLLTLNYTLELTELNFAPDDRPLVRLFDDLEPIRDGWRQSEWLGLVYDLEYPWIFINNVGWGWAASDDENDLWLWSPEDGWVWTRSEIWPWVWIHNEQDWEFVD